MKTIFIILFIPTICFAQNFQNQYKLALAAHEEFNSSKLDSIVKKMQPSNYSEEILLCHLKEFLNINCMIGLEKKIPKSAYKNITNEIKSIMYAEICYYVTNIDWNIKKSEKYSQLALDNAKPIDEVYTFDDFLPYFSRTLYLYHIEKFGELRNLLDKMQSAPINNQLNECKNTNVTILNMYAVDFAKESYFEKGIEYQKMALECMEYFLGENNQKIHFLYQNLGHSYLSFGDYKNAKFYLDKALKFIVTEKEDYFLHILYNQAWLNAELGNYELFESYGNRCLQSILKNLGKQNSAYILLNRMLAEQYLELGNLTKSTEIINDLEQVQTQYYKTEFSEHHAVLKDLMGKIYEIRNDKKNAFNLYQQSLKIRDSLDEENIYNIKTRYNLANLAFELNDTILSKNQVKKSFEYLDKYPSKNYFYLTLLTDFSLLDLKLNKKKSIQNYLKLLENLDETSIHNNLRLKIYSEIIQYYLSKNQLNKANNYAQIGLNIFNSENSFYTKNDKKISDEFLNKCKQLYYCFYVTENEKLGIEKLFYLTELEKLEQIKSSVFKGYREKMAYVPDSILSQEQTLKSEISFYRNQLQSNPESRNEFKQNLHEKLEKYEKFKANYAEKYPQFFGLIKPNPISLEKLKKQLDSKTTYITFTEFNDAFFAIIINNSDSKIIKLKQKIDAESIARFNSYENLIDLNEFKNNSYNIYNQLFKDLTPHVSGDNIFWIPSSNLRHLNPEILISNTKGNDFKSLNYLIKKYNFTQNLSATTLLSEEKKSHKNQKSFAGFAPVFDKKMKNDYVKNNKTKKIDSGYLTLLNQPFAEKTVDEVSADLDGEKFLRNNAREHVFKQNGNDYKILHLATHTQLNNESPLYSKIYFSHETDSLNDGKLHLYEIYETPIQNDLVVLSSCDGIQGKKEFGNNHFLSLSHSFAYAGSKNLIFTLWSVDEKSTQEILLNFYKKLKNRKSYATDLRSAKLDYLQQTHSKLSSPYYWGGIVIQSQSIKANSNSLWYWILGGLLIVFLAFILLKQQKK